MPGEAKVGLFSLGKMSTMRRSLKKASIGLINLTFTFLAGCSSSPYIQDVTTYPERVNIKDDNEKLKLSYLARDMMESDDRR